MTSLTRMGCARAWRVPSVVALLALTITGCSVHLGSSPVHQRTDPVIAAAGDIACDPTSAKFNGGEGGKSVCHEAITANLVLDGRYDAVLPLGDDQYECGDAAAFAKSYHPSWGKLKPITRPVIGNHEYGKACHRNDPSGYFDYFGAAASGGPGTGYYSFDLGAWHLIVLNSECTSGKGKYRVGGCQTGSPQESWLRSDLAAHKTACTLVAWHEPRFSSGEHGDAEQMADMWNDLVAAHVDVALAGHNHDYERFDPIGTTPGDPVVAPSPGHTPPPNFQQPVLDPAGIREFVVGTGGKNHYGFSARPLTGERVRNSDTYGLLAMTLHPNGYDWKFVPEPGGTFTDSGSARCN
jgi:hypothetical protein